MLGDRIFRIVSRGCAVVVLLSLGGMLACMALGGWPAFEAFGPKFLISCVWNPVTQHYGALAPIFGTLASTLIAIIIAVPLSFGAAYWLTLIAPRWISGLLANTIQLLAAIPSIIFGMWGFFVVVPFIAHVVQPLLRTHLGHVPLLGFLVRGPYFGYGLFTAGVVLAIMITPFITAIMQSVFAVVPTALSESAYGLGATRWEVISKVIVPWTKRGLVGGIVLGVGRALGETMAVTFVIGNLNTIGWSIFAPRNTVASLVALEFPESALGSLKLSALLALGFILMLVSLSSLAVGRWILREKTS